MHQAITSATETTAFVDRVIDDPEGYDEQPPPVPLDTNHLPSDEDLLRVRSRGPSVVSLPRCASVVISQCPPARALVAELCVAGDE